MTKELRVEAQKYIKRPDRVFCRHDRLRRANAHSPETDPTWTERSLAQDFPFGHLCQSFHVHETFIARDGLLGFGSGLICPLPRAIFKGSFNPWFSFFLTTLTVVFIDLLYLYI